MGLCWLNHFMHRVPLPLMGDASTESELSYRMLTACDYPGIHALISADPAGVSECDSEDRTVAFLSRNSRYCFGAVCNGELIGMIMCGCDGRSARIYHLNVAPAWRRQGVAHTLIGMAYDALRSEGIAVMDVVVFREAPETEFWESEGFRDRSDLSYRDFSLYDL